MTATRAVAYFLMVGGSVVGACGLLVPGFAGGSAAGVLFTTAAAGAMVLAVTDIAALVTAYTVSTIVVSKLRDRAEALVARLEEQALTDPLTALPNRRAFDLDLARALAAGAERCLLIVDVDHFKTINDTWGHGTGDAVLTRVGATLSAAAGPTDAVARLGGDEFGVLVDGGEARARRVAAEIRARVARTSDLPDGLPTLSIGLASTRSIEAGPAAAEALLAAADRAIYDAKVRGRDRVSTRSAAPEPSPRA